MVGKRTRRRDFLKQAAVAASAVAMLPRPARAQGASGRVVVVGGGFAGPTCARMLKRIDPRLSVALVEANPQFTACPFTNGVIAGLRDLADQQFGYEKVAQDGVELSFVPASAVDPQARIVTLADGVRLQYDRLGLA